MDKVKAAPEDFAAHQLEEPESPWYRKIIDRIELKIALKAGIAAFLSLYAGNSFAKLLDRPDYLLSGTWTVMSTFVVLQAHLGGTYKAAWVRFLGVLVGSFMGGFFTSIFGSNSVTLCVSVVFTVIACSALNLKESIRIACLSLAIVMILWGLHPSMNPWRFGLYRFLDSTIGILVAVVVSHLFWPEQATQKMRLSIANALHLMDRLFELELSLKPAPKTFARIHRYLLREIRGIIDQTRNFLVDSELELMTKSRRLEAWSYLIDHLENIFESLQQLKSFQEFEIKKIIDKELQLHLSATMEDCAAKFKEVVATLKTSQPPEKATDLRETADRLNEELARFRTTRTTRNFERIDVEQFFVFFYNLRLVIEELLKIEEKVAEMAVALK